MSQKLENIRFLVTKEILGQLSEEERGKLMEEIAADEDAKETRAVMLATAKETNIVQYINTPSTFSPADLVIEKIRSDRRQRIIYISSLAAAVLIIFFVGGYFLINSSPSSSRNAEYDLIANKNNKEIQLQLPNGQVINILDDTSQIIGEGRVIKTEKNTLSYSDGKTRNEEFATLNVPAGKDYSLRLSDGSVVQLNAATSIRFPLDFKRESREIYINGEAYLKVAFNPVQPFNVHLPNGTVQVLGTEFNVNTYDSGTAKISLVKGKVKVKVNSDSLELKPGQEALSLGNELSIGTFDAYETLSWRKGIFMFNNSRFDEVCKIVHRWFGKELIIENKQILDKRFTGKIDKALPLENLLKGLQSTNAIDYYLDKEGNYHIK